MAITTQQPLDQRRTDKFRERSVWMARVLSRGRENIPVPKTG
jgi:hypothetical protein